MNGIIDKIQIDDIEASILGARYNETNGGIAFQGANASGEQAFAVGQGTADGVNAFAEGLDTEATGNNSHAEGNTTTAEGNYSHAEGCGGSSTGESSHSEGYHTYADGTASHAEGSETEANGYAAHSEGEYTMASGYASHAEGGGSEDYFLTANGDYSHAEGYLTKANGNHSHAEGDQTNANGAYSHAEGCNTLAVGEGAHAEGEATYAEGNLSHTEGSETKAYGLASHAEGSGTTAYGDDAHAEGTNTKAGGEASHTEGYNTKTATEFGYEFFGVNNIIRPDGEDYRGDYYLDLQLDSIEGLEIDFEITFDTDDQDIDMCYSIISNINHVDKIITLHAIDQDGYILAEADFSTLKRKYFYIYDEPELGTAARNGASYAHAEGNSTQALGEASHAEGKDTKATGNYSHAGGIGTIASEEAQTVIGKYNATAPDALFIVGNGNSTTRSNAFVVKSDGRIAAGASPTEAMDLVTKQYFENNGAKETWLQGTGAAVTYKGNTTGIAINAGIFYRIVDINTNQQEIEYLNPPMAVATYSIEKGELNGKGNATINITGNIYRTAERFNNKPVYTCLINTGTSIDGSNTKVTTALGLGAKYIIRHSAHAKKTSSVEVEALPQHWNSSVWWAAYPYIRPNTSETTEVRIAENASSTKGTYTTYMQIWFTKEDPFSS